MKPSEPRALEIREPDLAWIAGLLEGEGYFCIVRGRSATLLAGCGMTDHDVIERLCIASTIGHISVEKTIGKTVFRWKCTNGDAFSLMRAVRPLMGNRRRTRIDELIQWYEAKLAQLPRYRIRHVLSGRVDEPRDLKAWCREHNVSAASLYDTLRGRRGPVDGFVREA